MEAILESETFVIVVLLAIIGLWLLELGRIAWGFWPRRRGDLPHCRRCKKRSPSAKNADQRPSDSQVRRRAAN